MGVKIQELRFKCRGELRLALSRLKRPVGLCSAFYALCPSLFVLASLLFALCFFAVDAESGTYTSTKHGNSSANGADRSAVTGSSYPSVSDTYPKGHCGHCHEQHASVAGSEPTPPASEGVSYYSLFRSNYGAGKNELCFACHETFNYTGTPDPPLGYGRYYSYSGKTIYNNSVHKTSASVSWPAVTPPGPTYLDAGNCNNCHNPHGYDDGSGVISSMLFKREDTLCTECHDGSPATKDIKTRSTSDTYKHAVASYSGLHLSGTQDTFASISANKHVECEDCHNPHYATSGLHTASADYQTATGYNVSNVLTGVLGATPTFSGSNWTTPTTYTLAIATKEYEICIKCHSLANTNVTSWGGSGAAAWTNVGLEFSTSNASYHPVAGALPLTDPGANGSNQLAAGQLAGGWAPGDTMYCSDCHSTNSATSAGPHGSSIKWMLSGTNKAWPYNSAAANGTSAGTLWTYNNQAIGSDNGLFCRNCHPVGAAPHTDDNAHQSIACVGCHIRVPHGGKVSRLQSATNSATPLTVLPARYAPDGNGGGTVYLRKFTKVATGGSYGTSACYSSNGSCGKHSSSANGTESW